MKKVPIPIVVPIPAWIRIWVIPIPTLLVAIPNPDPDPLKRGIVTSLLSIEKSKINFPPRNALPYDTIELPYYSLIW